MLTIKRKTVSAIKAQGGEAVSLCPKCNDNGKRQKMEERIYKEDPETKKVVIPWDYYMWRQCHRCGLVLPVYNLKHEGRLTSELVPSTNPFRDKGETKGISNNRIGKSKRGRNEEDRYNDPDVKLEIREGNQILGYSES
jgi:hypothetical protein